MTSKRIFDVVVAMFGLIVLAPAFGLIAVAIKLDSPGPAFHRGHRVGVFGRSFEIVKFRTMVQNANVGGPWITTAADGRVTRVGRLLRRSKVDELPQLLNVLRGDMSLVGPRPEDRRYVELYTAVQRRVLSVLPGMTSPASVRFRHETQFLEGAGWETMYINELLPQKIAIDLDYVDQHTFWTDIRILWATAHALFCRP
jgi:lipopolysaccharide/colanic/teichoic acid biosynthesis glycosyltransferase